ncbi:hypothetical protein AB0C50_08400 [Micromonospora taraxaci]|uniref:Immunity protein 50 of polymorphic toxin system n=1 Tax=Micromonospora taraxaci TaxID=1316803 RepID=A0A561W722_9ACTN|nr:hypothetical protein [Micromonospora taraxaci]TWG19679.1 hypothetical protein FHU34_115063 [Micromonospora taraxaci]
MGTVVHPASGLRKATLTDQELLETSWDHCRIHALAVTDDEGPPEGLTPEEFQEQDDLDPTAPSALRLHLDIDYIVGRGDPEPMRDVEYWVAPATLIFDNVWDLVGNLHSVCLPLELTNLRQEPDGRVEERCWRLEGRDMDLRFQASRYTLHLRRPPRYGRRVLRMAERGGISFDPHPFA